MLEKNICGQPWLVYWVFLVDPKNLGLRLVIFVVLEELRAKISSITEASSMEFWFTGKGKTETYILYLVMSQVCQCSMVNLIDQ